MTAFIYLADSSYLRLGICKIGFSTDPASRMADLVVPGHRTRPGLVKSWKVFSPRRVERELHAALSGLLVEGTYEWFRIGVEEAEARIATLLSERHYLWDRERAVVWARTAWCDLSRTQEEIAAKAGLSRSSLRSLLGPRPAGPAATAVFDLLRDGEHQRRKHRAAHARVALNKLGKGGVPALQGKTKERARKAYMDPARLAEDVAKEFGVSRQTLWATFGAKNTPDATQKGRRR